MKEFLQDNPHPLGSRECLTYEHSRHKSTAFGSLTDRIKSSDRVTKALSAWMNASRKKVQEKGIYDAS